MINQRMIDAWSKVEDAVRAAYKGPHPLTDEQGEPITGVALMGMAVKTGAIAGPSLSLAQQLLAHADDLDTVPDEFVGRCETLVHMIQNPQAQVGMVNVQRHVELLRRSGVY